MANIVQRASTAIWNRLTSANRTFVQVFGRAHIGGVWLSHEEAIRISAVWACVSVISKAIASSTWDIMLETPNGDREYQRNSRAHYLFNVRPNREMTPIAFHEAMIAVALLWGNSYAEIERDIANRPIALWPLDPHRCWLIRGYWQPNGSFLEDWTGELALRVLNYGEMNTYLHYEDVYHIHGLGIDGSRGLDLVGVAARSFLQNLAMERFGLAFYENGTSMGGVLSTDKDLGKEQLNALRSSVGERVAGIGNAFKFLVVGGGLKWQPLTTSLEQGQFNEGRYFLIEETCRWFQIAPHKIAHLLRSSFSNIEQQGIEFARDTLTPWAIRCQQEADYKILPAGIPLVVRINLDWAAEGDSQTKAQTDAMLVSNGLETRNENRRRRGKNSLGPEGDVLTIPANSVLLSTLIANGAKDVTPDDTEPEPPNADPQMPDTDEPDVDADDLNPDTIYSAAAAVTRNRKLRIDDSTGIVLDLFKPAVRRILKRQTNRAKDAARHAKGIKDFIVRLDRGEPQQIAYANAQLLEIWEIFPRFRIKLNRKTTFDLLKLHGDQDRELLINAQAKRNIDGWCDIEDRTQNISLELAKKGIE